ncbi:MAG: pyridoxamine 5'-phosphate oxidase family protein [Propionibacteriaceae bacterium]
MTTDNPVSEILEAKCWDFLGSVAVGRLATAADNQPTIYPLNYVVDGESVVFRSAEGSKLSQLTENDIVAFEADGWDEQTGWSVIIKGHGEIISDPAELARAERLPLLPWIPTMKSNFVRITAEEISGRRFSFGADPNPKPVLR